MIVADIEDFENNVRKYLDHATERKPYDNIFVDYEDKSFIILTNDSLEEILYGAIEAGRLIKKKGE